MTKYIQRELSHFKDKLFSLVTISLYPLYHSSQNHPFIPEITPIITKLILYTTRNCDGLFPTVDLIRI